MSRASSGQVTPYEHVRTVYPITLGALSVLTGISYVVLQWSQRRAIEDAVFVSMLIGATQMLLTGTNRLHRYLINRAMGFFLFAAEAGPVEAYGDYRGLCAFIINYKRMALSGLMYASVIAAAPFLLHMWRGSLLLRLGLSCFLFVTNFVTGAAFCSLIAFFVQSVKIGPLVRVDLWQVENSSTEFVLGIAWRCAVLASAYVAICLSSLLFSLFPASSLIFAYCAFASFVVVSTVVVPVLPIAHKMRTAKREALTEIEQQLQAAFRSALDAVRSGDAGEGLDRFESLVEMRDNVASISTWPFRAKSISATASVILLSSIPVVLEVLLEKL